ncbi:DNA mismatch repair endonuclease MutL [Silvibacterium dinghuense]|uniref:DNA mismatch repair protein MutL n=1 Tax=Silvibacterium dinghuense TaxID=1560006 RepID=A0A4Q1SJC8_9BACT|nr:DNA mismatch repair endonuclease MutL [Silvibacterium dinghuense]RXS97537.1 DNA mismatch repair endonuclease MutL [Silvibacterium dinghuense]GGG99845.1 DNA mismatch repair protein MutL [Silvibacterium dinghuense]
MGRIRILSDQVANQIAAGEVVDRPASVVKELLENSLDAGATKIRVEVEGGGRKLIRIVDNGIGMVRDDALLAFERHATSKIRTSDDLLTISTLGFRGEALPSIGSIARVELETRAAEEDHGTRLEIVGGKLIRVEDAGLPAGTTFTIRDLFFNTPARRKFLRSENTELSHVTALVTHYALVHPDKHFELHSASHALLIAPPVAKPAERIFQIFGREMLDQLMPTAAERPFDRAGLPEPAPWRRDEDWTPPDPGMLRMTGFVSKPELQKLNRNSIYVFVNQRLVRDRLILHAVSEAYRNVIPPTSFPVVLLFLEMPPHEVDVNVHPAKTEVRFRQQGAIHDFVRDSIRTTLIQARPAAQFLASLTANPHASPSLMTAVSPLPGSPEAENSDESSEQAAGEVAMRGESVPFQLTERELPAQAVHLPFAQAEQAIAAPVSIPVPSAISDAAKVSIRTQRHSCELPPIEDLGEGEPVASLHSLASLKPLGQLRESFIVAMNDEGLWIIDQHVAHERVLFEKILREREVEKVERQRLLMPLLIDLQPHQMVLFSTIAEELERNGFEAEPFGPQTIAIKAAPIGLEGKKLERMLAEVLEQAGERDQRENLDTMRTRIAASIACHAAIKVNMPLDPQRMEWLLAELAKTEHPTSCPHGRPIALRYSWRDIQRAFQRI